MSSGYLAWREAAKRVIEKSSREERRQAITLACGRGIDGEDVVSMGLDVLDRAVRAVRAVVSEQLGEMPDAPPLAGLDEVAIVRAVLLAIREPSESMIDPGWQAVIDLLAEKLYVRELDV